MKPLLPLLAASLLLGSPSPMDDRGFARAEGRREFHFPRDHGSHPEFATEWWYVTGHVRSEEGALYGFQATWFRHALGPELPERESTLASREVILFHGALTDVAKERFAAESLLSRAASSWAGSSEEKLGVWLLDRRLEDLGDGWRLSFTVEGHRLELDLVPRREPLLHGAVPGTSQKGSAPGEASHYYSQTRIEARGTLQSTEGGPAIAVAGAAWFDHELFSRQLASDQVGWDWLSVALDDGTDLMVFRLRERGGRIAPTSSGTLRTADGSRRHLRREAIELRPVRFWTSPASGPDDAPYPVEWTLGIPDEAIELRVEPVLDDQEHRGGGSGGPAYWEGLCRFSGRHGDREVTGLGYVELVGYRGGPIVGL